MAAMHMAGPCKNCGGTSFKQWEVSSGGGMSIKLLPLPFLQGGKLDCEACLVCGRVEWFIAPATLEEMRKPKTAA